MDQFERTMRDGPRIILVTGHFGSGKTEFAVSLAFWLAASRRALPIRESGLALADLDVENPYFRSRERQDDLRKAGVEVYSDPFGGRNSSEIQTISAGVLAPIEDPDCRVIVDTGGDRTGAMILNQFSRHFGQEYQLLQVVNCNRPGTDTPEKAVTQIREAEEATGMRVTGLVSNAHLGRFTEAETVLQGYRFTREVAERTGIPLLCACAADRVADRIGAIPAEDKIDLGVSDMELFRIGMYMRETFLDKTV